MAIKKRSMKPDFWGLGARVFNATKGSRVNNATTYAPRTYREIQTAGDADAIREQVEEVFDGWFAAQKGRIDWEDFLDRLDGMPVGREQIIDLGGSLQSPAIRRIREIVRELRAEA